VKDIVESVKSMMKTDKDGKEFVKRLIEELKKLL
jgi:hypothetical protein